MKLFLKTICIMLTLSIIISIFTVLPVIEADAAGYSHTVVIDTDNIEHGTVQAVNFTSERSYQEGFRCLMNVTPDEGYRFKEWRITAYSSGRSIDTEIYGIYHSFVIPVFPTSQRSQVIYIVAVFEEVGPDDPDGPYHVDVYNPDPNGTGSSLSVDHADGNYNAGDLVTVTIDWAPGTRFFYGGLSNSDYTDIDGQVHSIEFTQVNESTYTFIMPATHVGTDVRLSCFFEFIPYHVTYETDFGNADISDEEKAQLPTRKPVPYLQNEENQNWENKQWPLEAHRDQVFRVDTYNEDRYGCTGITAEYQENGVTIEKDIVSDSGYGFNYLRSVIGKMTMPASDVKLKLKMEYLYYVRCVNSAQGTVEPSLYKALPGDVVTLTANPSTNYACTGIYVTKSSTGEPIELSADNSFVMPEDDVIVTATYRMGYVDRTWDGSQVVEEVKAVPQDKMVDMSSVANHTLQSGKWYVVRGNVTIPDRLIVNGDVNIVLCDGATLSTPNGISVNNGATLHIYDQEGGTGRLTATSNRTDGSAGQNNAAIGADSGNAGDIYIHGGNISAETKLACHGAAIGGGGGGAAGAVKIYGGTVNAASYTSGAGIGGGRNGQASHKNGEGVVIYGGKVDTRGEGGAAIGNGYKANGSNGSIAIYGGEISAIGHNLSAGIGGGEEGSNGKIDIYNGTVTAVSSDSISTGAAIGSGGKANQGGAINIHDGIIVAQSTYGAGIGGGAKGSAGTIHISGGNVAAGSSCGGAGIGGGNSGNGGSITISDGTVVATSTAFDNAGEMTDFFLRYIGEMEDPEFAEVAGVAIAAGISAIVEYLIMDTEYSGAGIGGGHGGTGGNVNVTGGIVTAMCGLDKANAIGHGKDNGNIGSLEIYNTAKVLAGASEAGAQLQQSANRVPSCRNNKYAHIEPCDHPDVSYIDAGFEGHRERCSYCNVEREGIFPHDYWKGGECIKCHHRSMITIEKVWPEDEEHPDEVTVNITSIWKRSVNGYETDEIVVTLDEENEWKAQVPAVYGHHKLIFTEEALPGFVADSWTFSSPDLPDNQLRLPEDVDAGKGSGVLDLINSDGDVGEADYAAYLDIMSRENGVVKLKNKPAKTFTFKKQWPQDDDFDIRRTPDEITLRYRSGLDTEEKTVKKNEDWTTVAENFPFNGVITVTEADMNNFTAAGWIIEGGGERVMIPMEHGDMNTVVIPPPDYDELNVPQETRDRISTALAANNTTITVVNTEKKTYSVEKKWEIDFADRDRPDEISVVLQRRENWHTWKTVELLTLNPGNNWSGEFRPVAKAVLDEDPDFHILELENHKYRIRELGPKENEDDPDPDPEQEDFEERVKERLVYDKWDFDKDILKNLIKEAGNPDTYWRWEPEMDWVKEVAKRVVIPPVSVNFDIEQYNDGVKDVPRHTTKYIVEYKHDSTYHKMTITNTAAMDISIYKRWLNFKDKDESEDGKDEKPEYVYLMLESKVQKEYAEQRPEIQEANIYTPVLSGILGDFTILDLPPLEDVVKDVKDGISATMGGNFLTDALSGLVLEEVKKKLKTGICIAKVDGKDSNPLRRWSTKFTVKKYGMGEEKLPMDFAGTELITGFMEMAIDAIIKYAYPESNIHIPVMYHPGDSYWSITGYSLPIFRDYELTSNVINIKFHGDDSKRGETVGGTKYWKGDKESDRPGSVKIHVCYKDDSGTEHEVQGSPVTVTKGDSSGDNGWVWSLEIPKDSEDAGKTYYIREEVPPGYTAEYSGYDVINSKSGDPPAPPDPTEPTTPTEPTSPTDPTTPTDPTEPTTPTSPTDPTEPTTPTEPPGESGKLRITATRPPMDKTKEQSFIYTVSGPDDLNMTVAIVLRAGETSASVTIAKIPAGLYRVREKRPWSWRYTDAGYQTTTVSTNTAEVVFDHSMTRFEWLNGYSHR